MRRPILARRGERGGERGGGKEGGEEEQSDNVSYQVNMTVEFGGWPFLKNLVPLHRFLAIFLKKKVSMGFGKKV